MQLKIKPSLLLLCTLLLSGCLDKQSEGQAPAFDFEAFATEIRANSDYQEYIETRYEIFSAIYAGEVDLSDIHAKLEYDGIDDLCAADITPYVEVKGVDLYLNSFCKMKNLMFELRTAFHPLSSLSAAEYQSLFKHEQTLTDSSTEQASGREVSCIDEFNNVLDYYMFKCVTEIRWNQSFDGAEGCVDFAQGVALDAYDICCSAGGYGCPP